MEAKTSLAAIKLLDSKVVKSCIQTLVLLERHRVRIVWVPWNEDICLNEMIDECVRNGSNLEEAEAQSASIPLLKKFLIHYGNGR